MKSQFIDRLLSQPWHIGTSRGRTIIGSMLQALLKNERPEEDVFGDPLPKMQVVGDVSIIPVCGVLMLNAPDWAKSWGFNLTDPNDIEEEIDESLNNPAVEFIVLNIDSPGGESIAGEKLFDLVESASRKKPVFSFAKDGAMICSSAFQCAAPSVAILAGKFSEIGCIGTYLSLLDDTGWWEQMGIKWEVFRSGALKGIGEDALTTEQRDYLQQTVDAFGDRFRKMVSKYRTEIDPANMQGQSFRGAEAAQYGFTAGIAKDLDSAIGKFRKLI